MVSPGKPSPGSAVRPLSDEQVHFISDFYQLVDPTRPLFGLYHQPNEAEIAEQNPRATHNLLEISSWIARCRAKIYAYGLEQIPSHGIFITAASHVTQLDVFVPMMGLFHLGRRPRFMAKAELGEWPFVGWALKQVGMQPVPRRSGAAQAIEEESISILKTRPLTIWPEGTVSRDPQKWPMSFKSGLARIALIASAQRGYAIPIFPVATWGGASINNFFPWPRKNMMMGVAPAIDYSDLLKGCSFWGEQPPDDAIKELTARVYCAMLVTMSFIRGEKTPEGMWDYKTSQRVPYLQPSQKWMQNYKIAIEETTNDGEHSVDSEDIERTLSNTQETQILKEFMRHAQEDKSEETEHAHVPVAHSSEAMDSSMDTDSAKDNNATNRKDDTTKENGNKNNANSENKKIDSKKDKNKGVSRSQSVDGVDSHRNEDRAASSLTQDEIKKNEISARHKTDGTSSKSGAPSKKSANKSGNLKKSQNAGKERDNGSSSKVLKNVQRKSRKKKRR